MKNSLLQKKIYDAAYDYGQDYAIASIEQDFFLGEIEDDKFILDGDFYTDSVEDAILDRAGVDYEEAVGCFDQIEDIVYKGIFGVVKEYYGVSKMDVPIVSWLNIGYGTSGTIKKYMTIED